MDTRKATGKVIDPIDFTPDTIQGILPKEFALELVRRYKEVIAPRFDPAMKVMMFGPMPKTVLTSGATSMWPSLYPRLTKPSGGTRPFHLGVQDVTSAATSSQFS